MLAESSMLFYKCQKIKNCLHYELFNLRQPRDQYRYDLIANLWTKDQQLQISFEFITQNGIYDLDKQYLITKFRAPLEYVIDIEKWIITQIRDEFEEKFFSFDQQRQDKILSISKGKKKPSIIQQPRFKKDQQPIKNQKSISINKKNFLIYGLGAITIGISAIIFGIRKCR